MKKTLFILALSSLLLTAYAAPDSRTRTTRKSLKPSAEVEVSDSGKPSGTPVISPSVHDVSVKGYDKPLRSRRETFFVTNNYPSQTIRSLVFTATYLDTSGRMLHRRSEKVDCEIPPAQTRQIGVKSWDTQQNFYFVRSTVSSRAEQATPYDVTITVDTVFVY